MVCLLLRVCVRLCVCLCTPARVCAFARVFTRCVYRGVCWFMGTCARACAHLWVCVCVLCVHLCRCVHAPVQTCTSLLVHVWVSAGLAEQTAQATWPPGSPPPPTPAPMTTSHPEPSNTCHGRRADDSDLGLAGVQVERDVAHDGVDGLNQTQHHGVVLNTTPHEGTETMEPAPQAP